VIVAVRRDRKDRLVATKTKGGLLLPVVIVAVLAVAVVPQLRDKALSMIGGLTGGTSLVGEGENQFMVASSASSQVHKCAPQQELADQQCDDLKFIIFDAARMPFITRNISTAWSAGKPGMLTKDATVQAANRKQVCLPSFPRPYGGQCDEYPFASTREGGAGAQEQEVPARENRCQGGTLSTRYAAAGIGDGDSYLVVIIHPDQISQGPFQGVDIAKDQTCG
jgi:Deoxyribonuclease NucA/NucB